MANQKRVRLAFRNSRGRIATNRSYTFEELEDMIKTSNSSFFSALLFGATRRKALKVAFKAMSDQIDKNLHDNMQSKNKK